MSEDTPPPALRLKPRLRPNEEPAAGGAQPASPPPDAPPASPATPAPAEPAAADPGAPRLRLKPKLAAEPAAAQPAQPVAAEAPAAAPAAPAPEAEAAPAQAAEPAPTAAPAPEPAAAEPTPPPAAPAPEPPPAPKPPEAPAAEVSKFKLKPKAPAPAPAAATAAPPPPAVAPKPATRPPMVPAAAPGAPVAPPPVAPPPAAPPPLAPKPAVPPPAEASDAATPPPAEAAPPVADNRKKKKVLTLVIGLAAVVALAAAGYIAWVFFLAPSPPAAAPVTPVAEAPAAKPAAVTPSETLNQIAAAPKQMIDKAQDVIAARRGNEQDRVDAVLEGKEPPDKRFLDTPLPGHLGGQPAPTQTVVRTETQLAPGIRVTTSDLTASAPVSEEFRAFVSAARINGVFQGNPPRALINGRTIRAGEAADMVLGIVFDSVDPEKKTITFKDRTGATLTRKY